MRAPLLFLFVGAHPAVVGLAGCGTQTAFEQCVSDELHGIYTFDKNIECGCQRKDCTSVGLVCFEGDCCDPSLGPEACGGLASWAVTGNVGTDPTTQYLGTRDDHALYIKTNGALAIEVGSGDSPVDFHKPVRFLDGMVLEDDSQVSGELNIDGQASADSVAATVVSADLFYGADMSVGGQTSTGSLSVEGEASASTMFVEGSTVTGELLVLGSTVSGSLLVLADATTATLDVSGQAACATLDVSGTATAKSVTADTVTVADTTSTGVLEINGGADVGERFDVVGPQPPPGSVMVIDGAGERLRLADRPYDTRVAGVVSGAGDLRPGLVLRQAGRLDGSAVVAVSGRVYVLADATEGPITPGDLLTTATRPGHAMRADPQRAAGAIVGKALTSLRGGQGLVLMMVTLR